MHFVGLYFIIGRGVKRGCCVSPILYSWCNVYVIRKSFEGFRFFKMGGQVICTVKYTDDLMLLVKEGMVLQDMVDRLRVV